MVPQIRRNIIEPLWAINAKSPFLNYWKLLDKRQYLPEDTLLKDQWKKVKEIIQYAYVNNNYYKNVLDTYGVKPDDIQDRADIKKIPITTKKDIKKHCDKMISKGFKKESLLKAKTGGSTGTPLELYRTEHCAHLKMAATRRSDIWSGWKPGEPIGAVWGNPEYPTTFKEKLRDTLISPFIYLDTMRLDKKAVLKFADAWQKKKPTLLFGHSHSIYLLATFCEQLGVSKIRPKAIISTSMMLLSRERKAIEKVFGVKVFDRYGCEEVSLIASECEKHEGLHINIDHLFVEFIKPDGTAALPGEEGKIVVTDLLNKAMPMIRYKVEDVGIPSQRKCSCGRGLPLMKAVSGRIADFLIREDGSHVAGVSLIERTVTAIQGIVQMQIIQESIKLIQLNIVTNDTFRNEDRNQLRNEFIDVFGQGVKIIINNVKSIRQEKSGKYRFSISKIEKSQS